MVAMEKTGNLNPSISEFPVGRDLTVVGKNVMDLDLQSHWKRQWSTDYESRKVDLRPGTSRQRKSKRHSSFPTDIRDAVPSRKMRFLKSIFWFLVSDGQRPLQ